MLGKLRYWKEPYFAALARIRAAADTHGLTLTEVALRWMTHHSLLKREYGDAVIIGASRLAHIEEVRRRSALYYSASSVRGAHFMRCFSLYGVEFGGSGEGPAA